MPGVKVHNVPAEWMEQLRDYYEADALFWRDRNEKISRRYEQQADEVSDHIRAQGEHNA
jgi:hypothetical protein